MKKTFLLIFALSAICTANAQYQTALKVTHTTSGESVTDNVPFEGGEIVILDDVVQINFAENAENNSSYDFDKVTSFAFETTPVTAINNPAVDAGLAVSVDKETGILRLRSDVSLGKISIWSVSGSLLTNRETGGNETEINIASFAKGVYIVQSGASRVKFVK
ncbi:MAG: hypothetical protein EZS26_002355 [Candidatus Ordinivivax streblomastigis]|uniref:Secretion system C-terminal sorting domain-containing protein n=1 Tax=Candidatus Ordinivivax streblomastigis TaxID=2540710 RepID=A0A5M8NZ95_9BACT|nr:MAG: hypothetical protein EZS26_002355 [Candidatus Ordinivivax streblomastigis]